MFDPTAFDNMKVVLEGALYDRDLDGEISILDRDDIINMAKLTRSYMVTFAESKHSSIRCQLRLEAKLENLASELLPDHRNNQLSGAHLSIIFQMEYEKSEYVHLTLEKTLSTIWGEGRTFLQKVSFDPRGGTNLVMHEITIQFNRLIVEDQIDDLVVMLDYIVQTLEKLIDISS